MDTCTVVEYHKTNVEQFGFNLNKNHREFFYCAREMCIDIMDFVHFNFKILTLLTCNFCIYHFVCIDTNGSIYLILIKIII